MLIKQLQKQFILLVMVWSTLIGQAIAKDEIKGVRVWPAPENTRVVFDLSKEPEYSYFSLSSPERLVIDFKSAKNAVNLSNLAKNDPRIKRIRTSKPKHKNGTRLVLELESKFQLTIFPLAPAGQYGDRLVVDLFDKQKVVQAVSKPIDDSRDIVIGIDAGHGGEDPGSIGPKGTYEKRVTLAVAKKLEALINKEKGMKAVMIRTGDYYVDLNRRTRIARSKKVDFLVSIHADAFRTSQPSGASVWVVSDRRAKSELAKWLDNRQRNSELLGGGGGVIKNTNDDNLAITLADMNREHSLEVSIGMANNVISHMKKVTKMHKKTPQYKSLAVLKASDIPSMLVETGFISNHAEERRLLTGSHQQKLAKAIFNGVQSFFQDRPPMGTYYARNSFKKHKVSRGESLSVLAQRYKVSVSQLKSANNLASNKVVIGQTLKIPRAD